MSLWTTLLVLLPIVVIVILVWNFRRQAAAREAASAERMKAFFEATAKAKNPAGTADVRGPVGASPGTAATFPNHLAQPVVTADASAGTSVPTRTPATRLQPQAVTGFTARPQLTSTAQLAVFQLLQSALPGHIVLPRMSLAAFIQPPAGLAGFALEAERRRLADISVDFLICNAQLKPLAVVQCAGDAAAPSQQTAFAAACAASTGLRWLSLAADPLPAPEEIRHRVLGV